jgi:hypothetical protein
MVYAVDLNGYSVNQPPGLSMNSCQPANALHTQGGARKGV